MAYETVPEGSAGGSGLEGVTVASVVFGAVDGTGTWSGDFSFDNVIKSLLVKNPTDSAGQHAVIEARVGGVSAGNPTFRLGGTSRTWDIYADNAVTGDGLKIRDTTSGETRMWFPTATGGSGAGTKVIVGSDGVGVSGADLEVFSRGSTGNGSIGGTGTTAAGIGKCVAYSSSGNSEVHIAQYGGTAGVSFFGRVMNSWSLLRAFGGTAGLAIGTTTSDPVVIGTNNIGRLNLDINGNVMMDTAALATTATDGFFCITHSAGPPTGVPANATGVAVHYDTTGDQLYVYNRVSAAWKKTAVMT